MQIITRTATRDVTPLRERFSRLTAPRSAVIQFSPAPTERCDHPVALLEHLLATMMCVPRLPT